MERKRKLVRKTDATGLEKRGNGHGMIENLYL